MGSGGQLGASALFRLAAAAWYSFLAAALASPVPVPDAVIRTDTDQVLALQGGFGLLLQSFEHATLRPLADVGLGCDEASFPRQFPPQSAYFALAARGKCR